MANVNASTPSINESFHPPVSPRSSPQASVDRGFDFQFTLDNADTRYPCSKEQGPVRGRTLARVPATIRSTSRTTTRRTPSARSINLDFTAFRERLISRDLTSEPEDYYDDSPFEPLPFDGFRSYSLSAELQRAATFDSSIDLSKFCGHRDTFAMFGSRYPHKNAMEFPPAFYDCVVKLVDFDTFKAVRLTCRNWSQHITQARPIVLPPVTKLPAEILKSMYARLMPADFNAARHTCRAWMIASLDGGMLIQKLRAGGWWSAAKLDMVKHEETDGATRLSIVSEDWLLSKRLATECALLPSWTGDGLDKSFDCDATVEVRQDRNSLMLTSETSFSDLVDFYHEIEKETEISVRRFTVSVCQKYLLLISGSVIYLYSIRAPDCSSSHKYGGSVQPVTSVICSGNVLAVSMDTSLERYAIAALLEGRTGLVWDVERDVSFLGNCAMTSMSQFPPRSRSRHVLASSNDADPGRMSWTMDEVPNIQASFSYPPPHSGVPVSTGPHSMYHNVCSSHNPPRSLAICPQRRCVAFGNTAGIELHWIDALSGQDLQRWFPLSAASDFLYFLPNRLGVNNTRKLRVVSSAAHPNRAEEASQNNMPSSPTVKTVIPTARPTWSFLTDQPDTHNPNNVSPESPNSLARAGIQYYQAVPLSDGYNILFTDPTTGQLCLGGDAGPGYDTTQLVRRFIFQGPEGVGPNTYTAGAELRWGVRTVAAYGEKLLLFTVPPDVFFSSSVHGSRGEENSEDTDNDAPIRINGVQIARIPGLVQLAVDATGGDLTVWAFTLEGKGFTWQIAGSVRREVVNRVVLEDGTVAAVTHGGNDDVDMWDSDGLGGGVENWSGDYDGTALMPGDALVSPPRDHPGPGPRVDDDGDIIMADSTPPPAVVGHEHEDQDEGYVSGSDSDPHDQEYESAGGQFAIHVPPVHGRWSDADDAEWVPEYLGAHGMGIEDEGVGVDLVGLVRVEVEVLGG